MLSTKSTTFAIIDELMSSLFQEGGDCRTEEELIHYLTSHSVNTKSHAKRVLNIAVKEGFICCCCEKENSGIGQRLYVR